MTKVAGVIHGKPYTVHVHIVSLSNNLGAVQTIAKRCFIIRGEIYKYLEK